MGEERLPKQIQNWTPQGQKKMRATQKKLERRQRYTSSRKRIGRRPVDEQGPMVTGDRKTSKNDLTRCLFFEFLFTLYMFNRVAVDGR